MSALVRRGIIGSLVGFALMVGSGSQAFAFTLDGFYSGMGRQEAEAVALRMGLAGGDSSDQRYGKFAPYTLIYCGKNWDRLNGVGKQLEEKEFKRLLIDYTANFGNPSVDIPAGSERWSGLRMWLRWNDLPNGDFVQLNILSDKGKAKLSVSVSNNSSCKEG
jgi:hypothetical protein